MIEFNFSRMSRQNWMVWCYMHLWMWRWVLYCFKLINLGLFTYYVTLWEMKEGGGGPRWFFLVKKRYAWEGIERTKILTLRNKWTAPFVKNYMKFYFLIFIFFYLFRRQQKLWRCKGIYFVFFLAKKSSIY